MKLVFCQSLLVTDSQVSGLCKAFANNLPANMKLSEAQLSEIIHSGWLFLGRLLRTLMKVSLPLMKDALTPLS